MILYFVMLAASTLLAVGNLIWGALAQNEPWRLHLATLVTILTALTVALALLRNLGWPFRVGAVSLSLFLFLGIGILAGGYDHLLPVVLAAHGMAVSPPAGGFWYIASGVLLLPLGLGGLPTLKYLNAEREVE